MTLLPVHECPNDPPAAQLSGGAPPCSDQCSLASVGAMLSNEDITTVPPSEENQLRTPRPLSTFVRLVSGMWVNSGPQPRQPMAPVVQWLSSFSCSPLGGSPLSPLTAGQLPLAQLYLDSDEQRGSVKMWCW